MGLHIFMWNPSPRQWIQLINSELLWQEVSLNVMEEPNFDESLMSSSSIGWASSTAETPIFEGISFVMQHLGGLDIE